MWAGFDMGRVKQKGTACPFRSVRLQGAGPGGTQQEWAGVGRPLGKAQILFLSCYGLGELEPNWAQVEPKAP